MVFEVVFFQKYKKFKRVCKLLSTTVCLCIFFIFFYQPVALLLKFIRHRCNMSFDRETAKAAILKTYSYRLTFGCKKKNAATGDSFQKR